MAAPAHTPEAAFDSEDEPLSTSGIHYNYAYEDCVFFAPEEGEFEEDEVNDMDPLENGDWAKKAVVKVSAAEWNEALLQTHPEHVKFYVS